MNFEQILEEYIDYKVAISHVKKNGYAITIIENICELKGPDYDIDKTLNYLKQILNCNGSIIKNRDKTKYIQLEGTFKNILKQFLITTLQVSSGDIVFI